VITLVLPVDPNQPDPAAIANAAECLRTGGLVAFPTETVYGLGANALDATAIRRLFQAKNRPSDDPLIVHLADVSQLPDVAEALPSVVDDLAHAFWPGPLTLVLQKNPRIPLEVTAAGRTIAVRVPSHPVARALLRAAGIPVAAPSANLFSRPSPTRASHVVNDLDGRIDIIVDGGPATVGVESTVLDLSTVPPLVWRPGAVTLETLRSLLPDVAMAAGRRPATGPSPSPGLLSIHYAPRAPMTLYEGSHAAVCAQMLVDAHRHATSSRRVGVLVADEDAERFQNAGVAVVVTRGGIGDVAGVAARLYAALRELDASGVDMILASGVESADGIGAAVCDRLRRAAAGRIVHV
jgi:L-threonylcarbamoyladenylate synthase